jgi:hypothetical protein
MIRYPPDRELLDRAQKLDIPALVLVRDLVRVVEILSLRERGFFSKKSVLAGSMALRCIESPRFTVYDADFSTNSDQVAPPTRMRELLSYEDRELEILPAKLLPHDEEGTAWKSEPIEFRPHFTRIQIPEADRSFKADVSFRGLVRDGVELPLRTPYELNL